MGVSNFVAIRFEEGGCQGCLRLTEGAEPCLSAVTAWSPLPMHPWAGLGQSAFGLGLIQTFGELNGLRFSGEEVNSSSQ